MNLGQNNLRFWYYRFKDSPYYPLSLVIAAIFVCLVLIFQVIIPQVSRWFSIRGEIEATNQRIEILRKNINFVNNLDAAKLSTDIETVTLALPSVKDFGGILHAISASSLKAGVSLEDYSFQVGDVSNTSARQSESKKPVLNGGLSTVELTVKLVGGMEGVQNFLREIEEKLPIGEVVSLDYNGQLATVEIEFYKKDIPKISLRDYQEIAPLSDSERLLLQRLGVWRSSGDVVDRGESEARVDEGMPIF